IWPKLIGTLHFKEPADDGSVVFCDGGDSRLDVYLVTGVSFLGLTQPEASAAWNGKHGSTYIMLSDGLSNARLPAGAAHEIMHAIQWAYTMAADQESYGWLRDASANWAIDAVYGTTNQAEQAWADCFLSTPELPLQDRTRGHCKSQPAGVERDYGAYLFFQYLAKTFSEATVKSV